MKRLLSLILGRYIPIYPPVATPLDRTLQYHVYNFMSLMVNCRRLDGSPAIECDREKPVRTDKMAACLRACRAVSDRRLCTWRYDIDILPSLSCYLKHPDVTSSSVAHSTDIGYVLWFWTRKRVPERHERCRSFSFRHRLHVCPILEYLASFRRYSRSKSTKILHVLASDFFGGVGSPRIFGHIL